MMQPIRYARVFLLLLLAVLVLIPLVIGLSGPLANMYLPLIFQHSACYWSEWTFSEHVSASDLSTLAAGTFAD
jgi:hypothetical protein